VKALEHSFKNAVITFCSIHMKKNLKENLNKKVKKGEMSDATAFKIRKKIFGPNGVAASKSTSEFKIRRHAMAKYSEQMGKMYFKDLMDKLLKNVVKPGTVSEVVGFSWTNNR
jgi:hypothetical protein